ncbi:OmpA family protein [Alysiella crassa]|uniref:Outer membrane protein and related peptidoglycan-associated (Lipo)proteins n=1 Tax=Alysiella crassa TaxID=153491 RepID=A0A376BN34_9NEIS|nr:OmpA family protein [Alysiella crassa]UOP06808.1 OmpA family protein [Alysiella crassa]SSY71071.1 Outer membrane protein and related peptidoglycan-associated (lipo)proteins [Alysiella crassa]
MNTENNSNSNVTAKGERVGLWVGLGAAALTAIGVVGLAIYTDYKESNGANAAASNAAHIAEQAPSSIPTSEAQAASMAVQMSASQVQGMIAPSDEEPVGVATDVVVPLAVSEVAAVSAPVLPEPTPTTATTIVEIAAPAAPVVAASATSAPSPADTILAKENAIQAESKVVAENGMVRFYFATGKADVTANTLEALKDIVEGAKTGKKVVVLTYSNVESNERLARDRALAVRSVLLAAGIPDSSIEVSNPMQESSDSRRVEVILR